MSYLTTQRAHLLLCCLEQHAYNWIWGMCFLDSYDMFLCWKMCEKVKEWEKRLGQHHAHLWLTSLNWCLGCNCRCKSYFSSQSMTANTKCHSHVTLHVDILSPSPSCVAISSRNIIRPCNVCMTHIHLLFKTHHNHFSGLGFQQTAHLPFLPIILWMLVLLIFSECSMLWAYCTGLAIGKVCLCGKS